MPVDLPLSLEVGKSVSIEFKPNLDGLYLIEIETERNPAPEPVRCLMGLEPDASRCQGLPAAIGATWVLSSGGGEVSRGSSEEPHSMVAQSEGLARVIGQFPGKSGRVYALRVTFTKDGRSLAAAQPRLRVRVSSLVRTDFQSAGVLVFSIGFICVLFGVILLGVVYLGARRIARRVN